MFIERGFEVLQQEGEGPWGTVKDEDEYIVSNMLI